ncbi:MAG: ParB/RepB/Spo0J family partition protein [Actinomycetota bacterium]
MSAIKGGLGRGLSAILPAESASTLGIALRDVPVDEIRRNPKQPRATFDEGALEELTASIKQVGLLQPIVVRETPTGFELIVGERRLRASRAAGLMTIPVIVRDAGDEQLLRDALIENIQRVDLSPMEEAAAYRQLVDDFGATHEEIAARVGKSRVSVTNALRLLNLAPEVQQRVAGGSITAAHARAIGALADHGAQARLGARVVAEQLSVRQTEDLVRMMAGAGEAELAKRSIARRRGSNADRPAGILEAEMLLSDILGTRVTVEARRARGRIVIEYADFEDLDRIVRAIQR